MSQRGTVQIQAAAARALAEWKAFFADQVALHANELAKDTLAPHLVTVDHYRQAARIAVKRLDNLLRDPDSIDGRQEAA